MAINTMTGSAERKAADERRFQQQCYLMHVMAYDGNKEAGGKHNGLAADNAKCKYTSFIPIVGDPTTMISMLTGRSDLGFLTSMTPFQMSFLVPKIKLFKTYYPAPPSENAGKAFDVEFIFPDNIAGQVDRTEFVDMGNNTTNRLERLLSDRSGRGTGVGLREFSWHYEGTNPHEAANLLTARVSLHFNDIQELFEKKGPITEIYFHGDEKKARNRVKGPTGEGPYFRYVDLIMRTAETANAISEKGAQIDYKADRFCESLWLYDTTHFEIKALVGYSVKPGAPFTAEQTAAIEGASMGLYLTLVDHVISYGEDGSLKLDITYRAAVDGLLDDKNADLFLSMWERIRLKALDARVAKLRGASDQTTPTATGGTQAPPNSVTNPASQSGQPGSNPTGSIQTEIADIESQKAALENISRAVTINSLSDWIADTGTTLGNGADTVVFGANAKRGQFVKRVKDARQYTADYDGKSGYSKFPLTYGSPHGRDAKGASAGIPRIKWVKVMKGDQGLWSKKDGMPDFHVGGSTSQRESSAVQQAGGGQAIDQPAGASADQLDTTTQNQLNQMANPDQTPAAMAENAEKLSEWIEQPRGAQGDEGYQIPYVFYGDILDWAIRKALKRAPFDPDGAAAIDSMQNILEATKGATAGADTDVHEAIKDFTEKLSPDGSESIAGLSLSAEPGTSATFKTIEEFLAELQTVKKRMDKINIIVGSMSYWDPVYKKYQQINLADIPIALDVLNNWVVNRMMRPGVASYSLKDFIRDSLENLVLDVLAGAGCYEGAHRQLFDVGVVNFTMPAVWNGKEYMDPAVYLQNNNPKDAAKEIGTGLYRKDTYRVDLDKIIAEDLSLGKLTSDDQRAETTDLYDFVAIYCRTYEIGTLLGFETTEEAQAMLDAPGGGGLKGACPELYEDWEELTGDLDRGIYHLYLGQNQGLLKGISFSRTDQPYLAESRIFAHGHFSYNQLRGRYDANIRLQGNCLFLPGQLLYINPSSVGSGNLKYGDFEGKEAPLMLGLGGYYVVLSVENTITSNRFETNLRCIWHSSGLPSFCQPNDAKGEAKSSCGTSTPKGDGDPK